MDLGWELILLLMAAGLVAGFVDSIAGGGGLITLPALLLTGMPPVTALGTNKLQSLFGSGSATVTYASKGHVDLRRQWSWALLSLAGAAGGALLATVLPAHLLSDLLPFLLVLIAVYFALQPRIDHVDRRARIPRLLFGLGVVPVIGFYDGVFGPGTGAFFMLAYVGLAGFGLLKATAHTKLMNFASNVGAFIAFAIAGSMIWHVGLLMGVAQFAGARIGAHVAIRNGDRIIKPLLILVCLALAAKMLMSR